MFIEILVPVTAKKDFKYKFGKYTKYLGLKLSKYKTDTFEMIQNALYREE